MSNLFPFNSSGNVANRQRAQMEAQGYFAENYPRASVNTATAAVTGSVYYSSIGLCVGDRVSSIVMAINATGSGFSGVGMRVGIYSRSLVLLASSGDVSGVMAQGFKAAPLTLQSDGQPFTVPSTDAYYLAFIVVSSSPPTFTRTVSGINGFTPLSSSFASMFGVQAGQTDLPTTPAIPTATLGFWMGVA